MFPELKKNVGRNWEPSYVWKLNMASALFPLSHCFKLYIMSVALYALSTVQQSYQRLSSSFRHLIYVSPSCQIATSGWEPLAKAHGVAFRPGSWTQNYKLPTTDSGVSLLEPTRPHSNCSISSLFNAMSSTCYVKYWLESQSKPTNFHGVFKLYTITKKLNSRPILCGKPFVVVGIKRRPLLKESKEHNWHFRGLWQFA